MNRITFTVAAVGEIVKYFIVAIVLLNTRLKREIIYWIGCFAILAIGFFLTPYVNIENLVSFISLLAIIIVFDTGDKLWRGLFCYLIVQALDTVCGTVVRILYYDKELYFKHDFKALLAANLISFVMLTGVCLIVSIFLRKYRDKQIVVNRRTYLVLLACGALLFFDISGMCLLVMGYMNIKLKLLVSISHTVLMLILVLVLYFQNYLYDRNKEIEKENLLQQQVISQQEAYYQAKIEQYKLFRSVKHDIEFYTSAIKYEVDNGNADAANELLSKLRGSVIPVYKVYDCGNDIISSLISEYSNKAEQDKIKFCWEGKLEGLPELSDFDLSSLIGNLLKNAYEECTRVKNGEVSLVNYCDERSWLIEIRNATDKKVIDDLFDMKTEKEDEMEHGVGLKNVRKIIDRNDSVTCSYSLGENVLAISLYIRLKSQ